MPKPTTTYVTLFMQGQACLKVDTDDGRQVSMVFNRPDSIHGEPITRPAISVEPVKVFKRGTDEERDYNQSNDDAVNLLHALADVLGYELTPITP